MKLYERVNRFDTTYHRFIVVARNVPFILYVFLLNNIFKHRVH